MYEEKPVYWHQGLFLQPQHFQIQGLHQAFALKPYREYANRHFWGIGRLALREGALALRKFEIDQGEFLFPDGSLAVYPGNAVLAGRSFDEAWVEAGKPFTIYLGLKQWTPAGSNVTLASTPDEAAAVSTMFAAPSSPEDIPDFHGQGPVASVRRMDYVLRIFWESELDKLGEYLLIPVGQLERDGEAIRLSRRFVPPCVTLAASDWLTKTLTDIRDQVISRSQKLEEYKSPGELHGNEFDLSYLVFLLALRSLNRHAPAMQHLLEAVHVHPWEAYGVLRELAGELTSFAEGVSSLGEDAAGTKLLPAYDHLRLFECFSAARDLIARILDSISVGPELVVRLEFADPYYTAELPERVMDPRNSFWLLVKIEGPQDAAKDSFRRLAKLSATKGMTSLLARAVPGLPLELQESPPPGLPRRAQTLYFRINNKSSLWAEVERSRSIALYWDAAPENMTAHLVVLKG